MNELIEKFGQVAWEAAQRQVQLDIWFDVLAGGAVFIIALSIAAIFWKAAKAEGNPEILIGLVLLIVIISFIPLGAALKQSLNPEFYAIEKFIPGKN